MNVSVREWLCCVSNGEGVDFTQVATSYTCLQSICFDVDGMVYELRGALMVSAIDNTLNVVSFRERMMIFHKRPCVQLKLGNPECVIPFNLSRENM